MANLSARRTGAFIPPLTIPPHISTTSRQPIAASTFMEHVPVQNHVPQSAGSANNAYTSFPPPCVLAAIEMDINIPINTPPPRQSMLALLEDTEFGIWSPLLNYRDNHPYDDDSLEIRDTSVPVEFNDSLSPIIMAWESPNGYVINSSNQSEASSDSNGINDMFIFNNIEGGVIGPSRRRLLDLNESDDLPSSKRTRFYFDDDFCD